jgi:hypothetical protein
MAAALGLMFILLAVAAASMGKGGAKGAAPASVTETVKKATNGTATLPELDKAAKDADDAGLTKTADALKEQAEAKRLVMDSERQPLPKVLFAPATWALDDAKWTAYANATGDQKYQTVSPKGYLGRWLLGPKTALTLARYTDKAGTFRPPLTRERFLLSPMLQYDAFLTMTKAHYNEIARRGWLDLLPESGAGARLDALVVEAKPVTLSGLLAVAKQAGIAGLERWIKQTDAERAKYPNTMAAFRRANGIF